VDPVVGELAEHVVEGLVRAGAMGEDQEHAVVFPCHDRVVVELVEYLAEWDLIILAIN
jgi:hypothetical protein